MKFRTIFSSIAVFSLFFALSSPAHAGGSALSKISAAKKQLDSVKSTISNVKNVVATAGALASFLDGGGVGIKIPTISAESLFSSCQSKYVNATGLSACGQVDLGDLTKEIDNISKQTSGLSLSSVKKTATTYLTTQATTAVKSKASSYLLGN